MARAAAHAAGGCCCLVGSAGFSGFATGAFAAGAGFATTGALAGAGSGVASAPSSPKDATVVGVAAAARAGGGEALRGW